MFAGGVHYRFGVLANQTDKKVLVDLEKLALELVRPEGLASPVYICVRETFVSPSQRRCCRGKFSRAQLGISLTVNFFYRCRQTSAHR